MASFPLLLALFITTDLKEHGRLGGKKQYGGNASTPFTDQ
jgi:hypothetical protein